MAQPKEIAKTIVQCDFDGTITREDVSFLLLDAFTDGDWRKLLADYRESKITVGYFNTKAFSMIKADKQTLLNFIKGKIEIRAGFDKLLSYCRSQGFQFVIVSNGLDFYIESILKDMGADNIEVYAAQTEFNPEGIEVKYIGPDGDELQDNFKETYTRLFLEKGYRVIYIGNGISDLAPASQAHHVFATDDLTSSCQQMRLSCVPFTDLKDIASGLKLLK